jgi:hypothetical protein
VGSTVQGPYNPLTFVIAVTVYCAVYCVLFARSANVTRPQVIEEMQRDGMRITTTTEDGYTQKFNDSANLSWEMSICVVDSYPSCCRPTSIVLYDFNVPSLYPPKG